MDERISNLIKMIESNNINGFLDDIDQMAASKAYIVIRDNIEYKHVKMIKESGEENYKKFQDIKIRAKQSWDYDHKTATMMDIDRACMNLYTIVLRLMKVSNNDFQDELSKIQSAINKIEEEIGTDKTIWEESDQHSSIDGGNKNDDNVQRVEENI